MKNKIEVILQLRRDNEYNFEAIKNTFIPANGEVVLIDTAKDGLRAKVGDGVSTYAQLQFTDEDIRNAVLHGYLLDGDFYKTINKDGLINPMINKIFIDDSTHKIYYYDGEEYKNIQSTFTTASDVTPGIVKLYNTTGYNVDGTMTQKAITDELDLRYKTSINEETLIFTF
jgi:hypothetical protein